MNSEIDYTEVFNEESIWKSFRKYFTYCGVWLSSDRVWKIYSCIMTLYLSTALILLFYSIYYYFTEIENSAVLIHHTILIFDSQIASIYFLLRRDVVRILVKGMSPFAYESQLMKKFREDLGNERVKNMELALKFIIIIHVLTVIDLLIAAVLEVYTRDVPYLLQFPCWFPFDLAFRPYHILALCWQHALVEIATATIFGVLAFIYHVYSQLTTELVLLKLALENMKNRAFELAWDRNARGRTRVKQKDAELPQAILRSPYIIVTKMCAQHHSKIIEYYDNACDIFEVVYFIIFVSGFVVLTCTGFALISDNASLKLKFSIVTMIQLVFLYIVCWFGEQVAEKSEDIRLAIYGIEWYEIPKECQTTLRLMAIRTMKPLGFRTLTGQKVDLSNYMSMIKASYSYFNMMLAAQEKK